MEKLEQDVLNTFNTFWGLWAKRSNGEATINELKSYFDSEISSIGTGEHEIGKDLDTVIENFSFDLKELKTTYRGLVKEWHPDKFQGEEKKEATRQKSRFFLRNPLSFFSFQIK